jgi:hypothetical protein
MHRPHDLPRDFPRHDASSLEERMKWYVTLVDEVNGAIPYRASDGIHRERKVSTSGITRGTSWFQVFKLECVDKDLRVSA